MNEPSCRIVSANHSLGSRGDIHIYLPPGATSSCPFVFGIHGGGWRNGDQTAYSYMAPKLAPLGIALALVSYRLAPEHPFPAAYDDLVVAARWLREHGAEQGLDTSKCLIFGASAGGHL